MVIYNRWLVPSGFWAITLWPFIFVDDRHKDNNPLIVHEMVHYNEQAWISPIWWIRYLLSTKFRLAAEVRAYKAQIAVGGLTIQEAAVWLRKYSSSLTNSEAVSMLTI